MLGAIVGDISGSFREFSHSNKYPELGLFPSKEKVAELGSYLYYGITDDSILTFATAFTCMNMRNKNQDVPISAFASMYHTFGNYYKGYGYGSRFRKWLIDTDKKAYHSCGNGSAMRVSPIGYIGTSLNDVLDLSFNSACATHNHPEGIKGAEVTALMIYMARHGMKIDEIISKLYEFKLSYVPVKMYDHFDSICQETLSLATNILLTTSNFDDAVFKAVTLPNADSDTLGAIVGSIAEALYGLPDGYEEKVLSFITDTELLNIYKKFKENYYGNKII